MSGDVVMELVMAALAPQLLAASVTRLARRPVWPTYPATAIVAFTTLWYWFGWHRASETATRAEGRCGLWVVALGFLLLIGLAFHSVVALAIARLFRRPRSAQPD